ncbi:MAG: AmmeMemoRadiSam system radical SAM enzyme [Brevinematia bacterium]
MEKLESAIIARWWHKEDGKIRCELCPRYCLIGDGQIGFCFVRENIKGTLYSIGYARPVAINIDPIEKKPLYHFLPSTPILSLGTAGCNLGCMFCQNWEISKARLDQVHSHYVPPEKLIKLAIDYHCPSIAFTYNEPTIIGEYIIDTAIIAKQYGIKIVMVTNGYISKEAFYDVYKYVDAANVDLKAITEDFYKKITLSHLDPVKETLIRLKELGTVWFEITNLIIPTLNDSEKEFHKISEWILENLGNNVPLHFTAFHPDYKLTHLPRTPKETLKKAREIALSKGLKYVYTGNVFDKEGSTTYCPKCNEELVIRNWHEVIINKINEGHCPKCGTKIPGVWS